MSGFATRPATVGDIPAIIQVQKETWWVTYEHLIGKEQCDFMFESLYAQAALKDQMEVLGHHFFVIEKLAAICGFASFSPSENKDVFKLHKIYVSPAEQGTGAGSSLLSFVETQLVGLGAKQIILNVNRFNPARSFYEKKGYSVLYEEDIPIGKFWMNDYVMGKEF